MSDEQFRAWVWEVKSKYAEHQPNTCIRLEADEVMQIKGYKPLGELIGEIAPYGYFHARLYERRAPTAEERLEKIIEVGDAVVDLAAGFRLDDPEKRIYRGKLVAAWREAVEKGEARAQRAVLSNIEKGEGRIPLPHKCRSLLRQRL